jgi:hypothetical protein
MTKRALMTLQDHVRRERRPPVPWDTIDRRKYMRSKVIAKKTGIPEGVLLRQARAGHLDGVWTAGNKGYPVWFINKHQVAEMLGGYP